MEAALGGALKKRRVQREAKHPEDSKSGATLFGLESSHVQMMSSAVLDFVNSQTTPGPIRWDCVSRRLAERGPRWPPSSCQRVWRFLAYGQLFAKSKEELADVRSGLSSPSLWFAPSDEILPESDEEEMTSTPEELTIGSVPWKVVVLKSKARSRKSPTSTGAGTEQSPNGQMPTEEAPTGAAEPSPEMKSAPQKQKKEHDPPPI